jgi:sigma-B regulation protein RsbU (phosphoserine phosphatase)
MMSDKKVVESLRCMEVWGGNRGIEQSFELPGLDVWLYSRPIGNADNGGDVYYLSSCASGRISRLLLADVSGHGPEVSQLAIKFRELMRRNINTISQAGFVGSMNQEFVGFNQESRFATALVGTFFSSTRILQLCTAGHPQPLLFRAKTSHWEIVDLNAAPASTGNIPLGILNEVDYGQSELPLEAGDMLLAYTDGIMEARVGEGEILGSNGLLQLVNSLDATKPGELLSTLIARFQEMAKAPIDDDYSALLIRSSSRQVSLVSDLLVPFRLLTKPRENTHFRDS